MVRGSAWGHQRDQGKAAPIGSSGPASRRGPLGGVCLGHPPRKGPETRAGRQSHRRSAAARASGTPRQDGANSVRGGNRRGVEAPAGERGEAGRCAACRGSVQPVASCVARRGHGGAPATRCAAARALRERVAGTRRGTRPAGGRAPPSGSRRGRGGWIRGAQRGVLFARSRAHVDPRKGRCEPPVAPRIRRGAGSRRARRVERGAAGSARAHDQRESPNLDVHRALRAALARPAGRRAGRTRPIGPSRSRTAPRALARPRRSGGEGRGFRLRS